MKIPLSYITTNSGKFQEAQIILRTFLSEQTQFSFVQKPIHIDEIQGTAEKIALDKTKKAFLLAGETPVITDDVSLYLHGLGDLPGPYIKQFLESLGEEGIWSLASNLSSLSCHVTCIIGYMDNTEEDPHLFLGTLYGEIRPPKGSLHHGKQSWNPIFRPRGMEKNIGELSMEEIAQISPRSIAFGQLKEFLLQRTPILGRE
ncbi:MAG: non-canonical purine NTP pyrophosphatase [Chlamydia sp.]